MIEPTREMIEAAGEVIAARCYSPADSTYWEPDEKREVAEAALVAAFRAWADAGKKR